MAAVDESFSYPGIRAVFRVTSSEHAHGCLEIRSVDSLGDVCVVLVRCHLSGEWRMENEERAQRNNGSARMARKPLAGISAEITWRK